jgi:hypothetical protein
MSAAPVDKIVNASFMKDTFFILIGHRRGKTGTVSLLDVFIRNRIASRKTKRSHS